MLACRGEAVYVVRYGWTGWEFDARTKSRVRRGSTARLSAIMRSTSNRSQLSRAKRNPRGRGTLQRRLAGRGATAIRPRLLGLMERSAGLTVIDSPLGFGKTGTRRVVAHDSRAGAEQTGCLGAGAIASDDPPRVLEHRARSNSGFAGITRGPATNARGSSGRDRITPRLVRPHHSCWCSTASTWLRVTRWDAESWI